MINLSALSSAMGRIHAQVRQQVREGQRLAFATGITRRRISGRGPPSALQNCICTGIMFEGGGGSPPSLSKWTASGSPQA